MTRKKEGEGKIDGRKENRKEEGKNLVRKANLEEKRFKVH